MSLTELLEAVRVLSPDEREKFRMFLDNLEMNSRMDRFNELRGSASDDRFGTLSLEDFEKTRREIWEGAAK